ncbi:MAG: response regulator [Deltaproteobacteria bacterium]|jgi:DNA-binding response OmpR family regulator|nr:response regulator [Deltaproteobacteria bacterium]
MKDWKVLLVDDEKEFVMTLAERLGMRGIKVTTAFSGEEALGTMETYKPDVMILDLMMPGMSGLVVLGRVKRLYPEVEVILLTGTGSASEGVTGMDQGAFDYLTKPLQIDELINKIGMAVKKASSAD